MKKGWLRGGEWVLRNCVGYGSWTSRSISTSTFGYEEDNSPILKSPPLVSLDVPDVWTHGTGCLQSPSLPYHTAAANHQNGVVIDGKAIAAEITSRIADEVSRMKRCVRNVPGLAVISVGQRREGQTYVRKNILACEEAGFRTEVAELPESCTEEEVISALSSFNEDSSIHGVILQLPLPQQLNEGKILSMVCLEKDVDGLHPLNIGNLAMRGREPLFISCAPKGCIELLLRSGVEIMGKKAVVIGRSNNVGLPTSLLLQRHHATVGVVHAFTRNPEKITREADIVVAAVGVPNLVRKSWLKSGAIVIDVGTYPIEDPSCEQGYRLIGDVCYEEALPVVSAITPVPGGPMDNYSSEPAFSLAFSSNPTPQTTKKTLRTFSFAEIRRATKNFSPDRLIGEGPFGRAYMGWINEEAVPAVKNESGSRIAAAGGSKLKVAVKRWRLLTSHFGFEWKMELNVGMNAHPNLIELIGTCLKNQEMFLVYEYMENGSLDDYLFNKRSHYKEPLTWDIRISIALGAARGIAFLHSLDNPVIHRAIKTRNILLDGSYNPKISGFGLAIPGPSDGNAYVETDDVIAGTNVFAPPEYLETGLIYIKSDVYSFGVVLLEMITGRHAMDRRLPEGKTNIVDWARSQLGRRKKMLFFGQPNKKKLINTIIDDDMTSEYSLEAAYEAVQLAIKCTRSDPHTRPSMTQVVEALETIKAIK
ncbi:hypothetical protein Dimus_019574 [Dionaea muscipula]